VARQKQLTLPGLSLKLGGKRKAPEMSSFRVPALASQNRELELDEDVLVTVTNADGDVIVSAYGVVADVGFKKHRPSKGKPWVERRHAIELT
jgi:hypothetical protein